MPAPPPVPTRRFGKTELRLPVLSCGGMRYQHSWDDVDPADIPAKNQENLEKTIHRALDLGINHIETARGYGSSEYQLGQLLPRLPREKLIVQTKVSPEEIPETFRANLEKSMDLLGLETLDLFGFHGINNREQLEKTRKCLHVAREFQKDGRIRFVGFSTHGPTDLIIEAIRTGEFDYVNLHWYWIFQQNWPAIVEARKQDMGVFIISPSDKGGMLYKPTAEMAACTEPLSPMMFNDLFCLDHPEIHTLSLGAARPADFDEHVQALQFWEDRRDLLDTAQLRLHKRIVATVGEDWWTHYGDGLPEWHEVPGQINLKVILWLWTLDEAFGMRAYGCSRYGLLGNGGHWFPGKKANQLDPGTLAPLLERSPFADVLLDRLRDAHHRFRGKEKKRLSSA